MSQRRVIGPLGQPLDAYRLHYPSDVTAAFAGTILGPNLRGEYFVVVSAEYDEAMNLTTARVRIATPDDLASSVPA